MRTARRLAAVVPAAAAVITGVALATCPAASAETRRLGMGSQQDRQACHIHRLTQHRFAGYLLDKLDGRS